MSVRFWRCKECDWSGDEKAITTLELPDIVPYTLGVCPSCHGLESTLEAACDEPGCDRPATCGTPADGGYRHTCGEHVPERSEG